MHFRDLTRKITRVSIDSFRERSKDRKVVLLYPWTNYRNIFLSYFLDNARDNLLYYRILQDQASLSTWLADLVSEFNKVIGDFGHNLRNALQDGQPAQLAEALAADLGSYSNDQVILFLDEFDRTPHDEPFRKFVRALVDSLPAHVQVAVSSRLLTYEPWHSIVADGSAVVLGTEHRKDDVMFTVEETPKPQLEVYALGRGYALVNGKEITNWDGALPRNLFFYFIDHPLVTRDQIFEVFWPDLSVKEATNVFHVTKRKISERIGMKIDDSGSYELTQYSGGFYMPSDKIVRHYDVGDFQEAVERATIAGSEVEEEMLLRRAIDIYKAPMLQTINMSWVEERREQLRMLSAQALIGMGRLCKKRQEFEQALGFFVRALKEVPEREDVHRSVMTIYAELGRFDDARDQYRRLENMLRDTLNIEPSKDTKALLETINARG